MMQLQQLSCDENVNSHIQEEPQIDCKTDRVCLLAVFIWGLTSGIMIAQAFNSRISLVNRLSLIALPVNCFLFPFRPDDGFCDVSMQKKEKIVRIANFSVSLLLGISAYFIHYFTQNSSSSWLETYALYGTITLVALNALSCYGLHKRLFSYSSDVEDQNVSIGHQYYMQFKKNLQQDIKRMRKENQEMENFLKCIKKIIENHPVLFQSFQSCLELIKEVFPTREKDDLSRVKDPLVEEWGQLRHQEDYLLGLKGCFNYFLFLNPEFQELLISELRNQGFGSKVDDKALIIS